MIAAAAAFALGAAWGSFLNVCIFRIPYGLSIVHPPSRCPYCLRFIAPWDNVPVLAWFWLGGRCRRCRMPLSFQYPLVEFLFGVVVFALYGFWSLSWPLFYYASFAAFLIVLAFIDWRHFLLPDSLTLPGAALGLAAAAWIPGHGLWHAALGAALGAGAMAAMYYGYFWWRRREGLGWGDVKLLALIGAFLGPMGALWTVFLASFAALAFAAFLALRGRARWNTALPFGTFLCAGALVFLLWGEPLLRLYRSLFLPASLHWP